MSLSDLVATMHDSSPARYSFILQRFYSLRQFLSLYSSTFRLFQAGAVEMVSLVKNEEVFPLMTEDIMQQAGVIR